MTFRLLRGRRIISSPSRTRWGRYGVQHGVRQRGQNPGVRSDCERAGLEASMLRLTLAGAAPGAGEVRLASPSDCPPWAPNDGSFTAQVAVGEQGRGCV